MLNPVNSGFFAVVPAVEFSFMQQPENEFSNKYTRIGSTSTLWVNKKELGLLRKTAGSIKNYGNAVLWKQLFTTEDLLAVHVAKKGKEKTGAGFQKYFGKANVLALYGM